MLLLLSQEEGEELCNCEFSLAYGAKILLNNATMRLIRGNRYGLCGPNGVGKSTLMRAIANGQVDGFPPADELRTVYVEHDIQVGVGSACCWASADTNMLCRARVALFCGQQLITQTNFVCYTGDGTNALSYQWGAVMELKCSMFLAQPACPRVWSGFAISRWRWNKVMCDGIVCRIFCFIRD